MSELVRGFIGKEDIKFWDGGSNSFTRKTITGGSESLTRFDSDGIDVLHAYGNGSDYTGDTIQSALSFIGSTNNVKLRLTRGTWIVSSNLTIGSNIVLQIDPGAVLTDDANNADLTINGSIIAAKNQQIFDWGNGSGSISFLGNKGISYISPHWFGSDSSGYWDTALDWSMELEESTWLPRIVKDSGGLDRDSVYETNGTIDVSKFELKELRSPYANTIKYVGAADDTIAVARVRDGALWRLENIKFHANDLVGYAFAAWPTSVGGVNKQWTARNCQFFNATVTGLLLGYPIGTSDDSDMAGIHLVDCDFRSNGTYDCYINVTDNLFRTTFDHCSFNKGAATPDSHVYINFGQQIEFQNCYLGSNSNPSLVAAIFTNVGSVRISNCQAETTEIIKTGTSFNQSMTNIVLDHVMVNDDNTTDGAYSIHQSTGRLSARDCEFRGRGTSYNSKVFFKGTEMHLDNVVLSATGTDTNLIEIATIQRGTINGVEIGKLKSFTRNPYTDIYREATQLPIGWSDTGFGTTTIARSSSYRSGSITYDGTAYTKYYGDFTTEIICSVAPGSGQLAGLKQTIDTSQLRGQRIVFAAFFAAATNLDGKIEVNSDNPVITGGGDSWWAESSGYGGMAYGYITPTLLDTTISCGFSNGQTGTVYIRGIIVVPWDYAYNIQALFQQGLLVNRASEKETITWEVASGWNPGSIADGDEEAHEITVTGAALGDYVIASFSLDVQDLQLSADVTAANTVTVVLSNSTGGAVDLGDGAVRVKVFQR